MPTLAHGIDKSISMKQRAERAIAFADRRAHTQDVKPPANRARPASSPFKDPVVEPVEQYTVGDRVTHDRFGLGRVVAVEDDASVTVNFGASRVRVCTPYVKMTKL
jgi:hypothetical protein